MDNYADHNDDNGETKRFLEGDDRHVGVLEMEAGDDVSLLRKSVDSGAMSRGSLRMRASARALRNQAQEQVTSVLGFLRSSVQGRYTVHGMALLGFLALMMLIPLGLEDEKMAFHDHDEEKKPHGVSMGGDLNIGHDIDDPQKNDYVHVETEEYMSAVMHPNAVLSFSQMNRLNYQGHFWHDPYRCPFASPLYLENENGTHQVEEQTSFEHKRAQYIQKYGAFDPPPSTNLYRHAYEDVPYQDVTDFQDDAWQVSHDYVAAFLDQALALVRRVQEGIYEEYGLGANQTEAREDHFRVIQREYQVVEGTARARNDHNTTLRGIAYLRPRSWEGLVRKLWHTMLTHNTFYVVVVGPDSTYKFNNFFESQIMQFNEIMEPVFDKLGMKLLSRNMGMDASTTLSALGGASIYGETDILWHIPNPERHADKESTGQLDLLFHQAILSGERVPLILTPTPGNIQQNTNDTVWVGNLQPGQGPCPDTGLTVTPAAEACRFLTCDSTLYHDGACRKYRNKCWVPRPSRVWNPPEGSQVEPTPNTADDYNNYQQHRWEGRKLSMLVLKALEEALQRWRDSSKTNPPPKELWHVGNHYEKIRHSLERKAQILVHEKEEGQEIGAELACQKVFQKIDPGVCYFGMKALTEWTPRVNPTFRRLATASSTSLSSNRDRNDKYPTYDNLLNLRPLEWKLPPEAVDVHMIALATNSSVNEGATAETFYPHVKDVESEVLKNEFEQLEMSEDESEAWDNGQTRQLTTSGWHIHDAPAGFCDGSAQSICHRVPSNPCILANKNHYRGSLMGHGDGQWLNLTIPTPLRWALVVLRFDWNDATHPLESSLPADFRFTFELRSTRPGKSDDDVRLKVGQWSREEFLNQTVTVAPDVQLHVLSNVSSPLEVHELVGDPNRKVEVGIRVESESAPSDASLHLTHLYYA